MNKNRMNFGGGQNSLTSKWLLSLLMAVLFSYSTHIHAYDVTTGKWKGVNLNLTTETASYGGASGIRNTDTHSDNSKYLASGSNLTTIKAWDNFDVANSSVWDQIVFFYHPATGKWLNQGGPWGTKAVLSADYGVRCLVSMDTKTPQYPVVEIGTADENKKKRHFFAICTSAASGGGKMLAEKEFEKRAANYNSEKYNYGDSKDNPYCDGDGSEDGMQSWSFIPFTDNQASCNEFGIRARYGSTSTYNHYDFELRYITYDPATDEVYIKRYANEAEAKADENTHWRMVTLREIYDALSDNPSDVDNPFNVTFWLKDPQLARCNSENSSWSWSQNTDCKGKNGLKLGIDNLFSGLPSNSTSENRYGGDWEKDRTKYMQAYGKYFCGEVRAYPNTTFMQKWTCVKSGWYRLSCQGFVKDGDSKLYAYVSTSNNTRVDYQSEALRKVTDYDEEAGVCNTDTVTTMLQASPLFMNKLYPNYLYVYCEQGQTMEFGLRFKGASAWTCFDDFQLEYCGEEKVGLVLDEDATKLDYIADAYDYQKGFKNTILHLHHSFNAGYWNTIVLPVELTKSQVEHMFGKGTKVAKFVDYQTGRIMFNRTESESTKGSTVIMEANVPYIIKPTYTKLTGGRDYDSYTDGTYQDYAATFKYYSKSGDNNQPTDQIEVTCPAPYATTRYTKAVTNDYISNEEFGTKDLYMKDDNADAKVQWNGLAFHGNLVSTYKVNEDGTKTYSNLAKGGEKYLIYQNKIAHVAANRTYGFKGLRAYFEFEKKSDSDKAQAKGVKFSIDGVDEDTDNVTGIDGLFEGGIANTDGYDGKVYDLNGRVVNTCGSTEGLTKGIYIVKGKKVVVK